MFDGGKLVHHWGVWGYQMRLEAIQLKVGGIGAVVTHPDYRKQNIMHQAAHDSFEAMRQMGTDLSILHGRHYVKMGYARAWNDVNYRFKLEDFPDEIIRQARMECSGLAQSLVKVLFPNLYPMLSHWDEF